MTQSTRERNKTLVLQALTSCSTSATLPPPRVLVTAFADNTSQQSPSPATTPGLQLDQSPVSDQASARAFAGADLLASPLPSKSASIFRAREAGTRAFRMRFSRPGTILERF